MINYVFPAPAGINRAVQPVDGPIDRVPRASGDKPPVTLSNQGKFSCSPRQRG